MAVTKLSLYNDALLLVGERALSIATEDVPVRYDLDRAYDDPAAANYCLELAKPKFAMLVGKLTAGVAATNHLLAQTYAFPADYIAYVESYDTGELDEVIHRYIIEDRTLYCDVATNIWVRYITNGIALANWTPLFANIVSAYLAKAIAPRVAPQKVALLEELFASRVKVAVEFEGVKETLPRRPPSSTFTLTSDYQNVYNGALNLLGKPQIISTNDDSEIRVALDTVIDSGAVNYLYEVVKPMFALETNKLTSSSTSSNHDFDNVFTLPSDYLAICELHADPLMDEPINQYLIEGRTLACKYSTIYLRFISSSPATSDWTPGFKQLLSAYMADQIKARFVEDADLRKEIYGTFQGRLKYLLSKEGFKESHPRANRTTATLDDTWRKLYNKAFFILGLDEIVSNDDDSDRRAKADSAIGQGLVETVLEDVGWSFAITSQEVDYDSSLEPAWGHHRVFAKPSDMHRFDGIFQDSFFRTPLKDYADEGDNWYCGLDKVYIQYVKTSFLTAPSSWPQYFTNYVAGRLAIEIGPVLGGDMENAWERLERYDREAQSTDAMQSPPQFIKQGQWAAARTTNRRPGSYNQRP
jgi:hypothetical protein|tara:strand:- start:327 stop:2081 length:1755 start_codon:yes stop_codon:yes gene_type:complete